MKTHPLWLGDKLSRKSFSGQTEGKEGMDEAKNFAKGTLSQGYDDAATSIVLATGDGARFPAAPFNAVWWNASDYPDPADDPTREIVRVTTKSTDTFTVTRGAEGEGPYDHQSEGKTYKLSAPPTAKLINDDLPDIGHTNDTYDILSSGELRLSGFGAPLLRLAIGENTYDCEMGDLDGNNSGVKLKADDTLGQLSLFGKIGTDQSQSASVGVGTISKKLQVFDNAGNSLGFIPIYSSIT